MLKTRGKLGLSLDFAEVDFQCEGQTLEKAPSNGRCKESKSQHTA